MCSVLSDRTIGVFQQIRNTPSFSLISCGIGKNCIFGGQVGIMGHIKIADNTTVGAQAGIAGPVRKSGQILIGSPAIPHMLYMRSYAKFKQAGAE